MHGHRAVVVAGVALVSTCGASGIARAEAPTTSPASTVAVELVQCARLDALRIRDLFILELGRAVDTLGPERLIVTCGLLDPEVRVESPRLGAVARTLHGTIGGQESERLVALAAAQLVLAAWVESPQERAAEPAREETETTRSPVATTPQKAITSVDIGAFGAFRVRSTFSPGLGAGLLTTFRRDHWGLGIKVSLERALASRALGTAEMVVGELALVALYRSSAAPLALEAFAGPALARVRLRGIDPQPAVHTAALSAWTLDTQVALGVGFRSRTLWLFGAVEAGYLVAGPVGTISADRDLETKGPWAGAMLGGGGTF
jgi:hypothetical protein